MAKIWVTKTSFSTAYCFATMDWGGNELWVIRGRPAKCEAAPPIHTVSQVSLSLALSLHSSPVPRLVLKFMFQTTDWLLGCRILARRSFILYCP